MSWNDGTAFCQWLSRKEGRTYRLPTEAEWEYACRAGTTTRFWNGDDPEDLAPIGNVADAQAKAQFPGWKWAIRGSDGYVYTAPVGKFRANDFGLYDMHGNVWELCEDQYDAGYYAVSPANDPQRPHEGSSRVYRGGCWDYRAGYCRSAFRFRYVPEDRINDLGFRVARSPSGK